QFLLRIRRIPITPNHGSTVERSWHVDAKYSREWPVSAGYRFEHRESEPSHNNQIDRISDPGHCQHKRIQAMDFQTRRVERNHYPHHCAHKVDWDESNSPLKQGTSSNNASARELRA